MRPSEVFGIVVRSVGLIVLVVSLPPLCLGFLGVVLGGPGQTVALLIFAAPSALAGLWLLRGAQPIVNFAFPGEVGSARGGVAGPEAPASR